MLLKIEISKDVIFLHSDEIEYQCECLRVGD